jgi:hypothetical protein
MKIDKMATITNKDIIVVAPEQYRDLARKLSHEIAKKTGLNGAYWTIKQYEDNEFLVGAARYVILLGNSDENNLTKDYLPIVGVKLINRAGACFGYDGSKALVFGEGKLDQAEDFHKLLKEVMDNPKTTAAMLIFSPSVWYIIWLGLTYWLYKYFDDQAKRKKLRRSQTEVALTLFLTETFDQMAGIMKTE